MKLFISWSGDSSKAVAEALRDWLPCVMQALKPWMSEADLKSGSRWGLELAKALSDTRIGIICLTPDNISEPWILFEAGALSKTLDKRTLVCTYLLGMNPADLTGPLAQFQATLANKAGTRKVLSDINQVLDEKLSEANLDLVFEALWSGLDNKLQAAASLSPAYEHPRSEKEIAAETLALVRQEARSDAEFRNQISTMVQFVQELLAQGVVVSNPYFGAIPMTSVGPNRLASGAFTAIPSRPSTQATIVSSVAEQD
jgi:hypothetical protein